MCFFNAATFRFGAVQALEWDMERPTGGTPRAASPRRAGSPRPATPRATTPRATTPRATTPRASTPRVTTPRDSLKQKRGPAAKRAGAPEPKKGTKVNSGAGKASTMDSSSLRSGLDGAGRAGRRASSSHSPSKLRSALDGPKASTKTSSPAGRRPACGQNA